jgi:hypothetical protein
VRLTSRSGRQGGYSTCRGVEGRAGRGWVGGWGACQACARLLQLRRPPAGTGVGQLQRRRRWHPPSSPAAAAGAGRPWAAASGCTPPGPPWTEPSCQSCRQAARSGGEGLSATGCGAAAAAGWAARGVVGQPVHSALDRLGRGGLGGLPLLHNPLLHCAHDSLPQLRDAAGCLRLAGACRGGGAGGRVINNVAQPLPPQDGNDIDSSGHFCSPQRESPAPQRAPDRRMYCRVALH